MVLARQRIKAAPHTGQVRRRIKKAAPHRASNNHLTGPDTVLAAGPATVPVWDTDPDLVMAPGWAPDMAPARAPVTARALVMGKGSGPAFGQVMARWGRENH
ncbi:MAG: hypothetical protein VR69_14440 [Peptococcaceae bacterium BRH_c4b]|nr:MAG: hypothetical protein VR69_14440 [Peptococcaceae bacterium BRH_c4b]